jgi:hypothetical protein
MWDIPVAAEVDSAGGGGRYTWSADAEMPDGTGIDGSAGQQPRGSRLIGNVCHEIGYNEKQSSCWGQACDQHRMRNAAAAVLGAVLLAAVNRTTLRHNAITNHQHCRPRAGRSTAQRSAAQLWCRL